MHNNIHMKQNSLILFAIALLFGSCNFTDRTDKKTENTNDKDNDIVLQIFTELPDAIDGCACLFAEDNKAFKKGEYLYADNMQTVGFVKIDGEMLQVTLDESDNSSDVEIQTTGKNEDIEVKLDIRKSDQLDYQGSYFGTLEVKTTDGRKYKKTIFGECGC
ncbi:hypothetical protein SAMN05660206_11639 [Sphingobacterium wenxiniae]|uniref:Uncharacterized protein n=2 Tax=Sphingobacterium wenxiniae TaxID=683125 RepID=A0A1I6VQK3_9SPHI|nr:hypothetical protein SAMN05660206_11639 [Sphingobacterium wenxiniae]